MKSKHLRDARLIASTFAFVLSLSLSACAPAESNVSATQKEWPLGLRHF